MRTKSTATDIFRFEAEIHLFDPEGKNEGYGVFFGGRNLESEDIGYDYFLIRNSGEYLIKGRDRALTEVVVDWTPSPAIHPFTDATEGSMSLLNPMPT